MVGPTTYIRCGRQQNTTKKQIYRSSGTDASTMSSPSSYGSLPRQLELKKIHIISSSLTMSSPSSYDRFSELKAFDETKAGVKGLVDRGIPSVPCIFQQPAALHNSSKGTKKVAAATAAVFPTIDLGEIKNDRQEVVRKVREAMQEWGFFQVINHGIPTSTLEEMLEGNRRFHDQDEDLKKVWYGRDDSKATVYNSNFDLYKSPRLDWRDNFFCTMFPQTPKPEDLPEPCRNILIEYSKQVLQLGNAILFELLSEALGLAPNHLKDMGCADGLAIVGNYYPKCPQPELTLGSNRHTDKGFLSVLLQDQHVSGLQVLHKDEWVDVLPTPRALVINAGDLLQLITNDRFKSVEHRVLSNDVSARVSVACLFTTGWVKSHKVFGPISELVAAEGTGPKYQELTVKDFVVWYNSQGLRGNSALQHFRL